MKRIILIFLVTFGCTDVVSIDKQIIGYWEYELDEAQLIGFGMKKEDIIKSAAEMRFFENKTIEVRAIDPTHHIGKSVIRMSGTYNIENGILKISLMNEVQENQKIYIDGNIMKLEPKEYKGKVVNKYKKISEWSLKI